MQNLIFSLNATLPVFLVMVAGYALGQWGFLPPEFCRASDKLTFKITLPIMLFLDMGSVDILHDFQPKFVLFCFGVGIPRCCGDSSIKISTAKMLNSGTLPRIISGAMPALP